MNYEFPLLKYFLGFYDGDDAFAAGGGVGHGAGEEVGHQLLHLFLREGRGGAGGHLARQRGTQALAAVAKFLQGRGFVVGQQLLEERLQVGLLHVGGRGGYHEGGLPHGLEGEAVVLQVGQQLAHQLGVGGRELAVDGEKQRL